MKNMHKNQFDTSSYYLELQAKLERVKAIQYLNNANNMAAKEMQCADEIMKAYTLDIGIFERKEAANNDINEIYERLCDSYYNVCKCWTELAIFAYDAAAISKNTSDLARLKEIFENIIKKAQALIGDVMRLKEAIKNYKSYK